MTEEQVFLAALEIASAGDRSAYLDKACRGDAEFRRQVEGLLTAHFKSGEFLDQPMVNQTGPGAPKPGANDTVALPATSEGDDVNREKQADKEFDDLTFLGPTTRTDSLGRIGHYEVLQVLGKGGFGVVLRAFDDVLQRVVALKVLAPNIAATSPARKRFLREARAAAKVRHENVVQIHAVEDQPLPYLVMEYIPGETLQQRLDRIGPLDVAEALRIARQIAEGLAAAHETGLIHRDIKPGNILIEKGPHEHAKITDFGLARAADDASMTQSGVVAGTPMYMAPEQAKGDKLDHRADLFSLGSVMYVMASGRPPFRAATTFAVLKRVVEEEPRSIQEIIPEVPSWLCDIIARLQAKNPDDRFQTAREVADLLSNCEVKVKAKQEVERIRPAAIAQAAAPVARPPSSGRGKWLAAAAAVVLLPVIALAVTEFAGVTHLFRGPQAVPNPINPDKDPTPISIVQPQVPPKDAWVQLFNGKDLTGWKTHAAQPRGWSVENGALIGRALAGPTHLFTERGDFENFHVRVEAKITDAGDSGLFFRTAFGLVSSTGPDAPKTVAGDEAQIAFMPHHRPTGSLMGPPGPALGPNANLMKPDTWFTLDLIADGNHIVIKLDGRTTVDYLDQRPSSLRRGHLALQAWSPGTVVQFRKIEIKELPPTGVDVAAPWTPLFNGRGLVGWTTANTRAWSVDAGAIVGEVPVNANVVRLNTVREDLQNFKLRTECKTNGGTANLWLRAGSGQNGYKIVLNAANVKNTYPGSVCRVVNADRTWLIDSAVTSLPKDTWFTLECHAIDDAITIRINDKEVGRAKDATFAKGSIKFETINPGSTVHVRKIEIVELPPIPLHPTFKNGIGMEFVLVPKGNSWLGGGKDKPGDKNVEIPADFYLGKYEVTQEEWEKVMEENPSHFSRTGKGMDAVKDIPEDLKRFPVENVTWDQCQIFLAKLNQREKATGWVYRLPMDVEWEYACRGGPMADKVDSAFDYYFAKPMNTLLPEQANFNKGLNRTCKVGSYEPNALGLYDMHGNVWEWCELTEKAHGVSSRFYIGGSHTDSLKDTRPVPLLAWISTYAQQPLYRYHNLGLRLARVPVRDPDRRAAEYVLSIGGKFRINDDDRDFDAAELPRTPFRLTWVDMKLNKKVTDAGLAVFKDCQHLTYLDLGGAARVSDVGLANFAGCKNLTLAALWQTQITDVGLAYFKDCKNLKKLWLNQTRVSDAGLKHLAGMTSLEILYLVHTADVTTAGKEELAKSLPLCRIIFGLSTNALIKTVATLPASEQIEEVRKELIRRNPGFDGQLRSTEGPEPKIVDGVVINLSFLTENVKDISPVRALAGLRVLQAADTTAGKGKVADLSPLKGLSLIGVFVGGNPDLTDLSPLEGMPIIHLSLWGTNVASIEVVKDLPIQELYLDGTRVVDLAPLAEKSLKFLALSPKVTTLKGLPAKEVKGLLCNLSQLPDEAELQRLGVTNLVLLGVPNTIDPARLRDLGPRLKKVNNKSIEEYWKENPPPAP